MKRTFHILVVCWTILFAPFFLVGLVWNLFYPPISLWTQIGYHTAEEFILNNLPS